MEGNNLKRKKRKTRKCLDELRKKSRLADTSDIVAESSTLLPGINRKSLYKQCNNITKGRLTLKHGMFAKGVRSETATRAGLNQDFIARRDEDLLKIIDLANGGPSHTVTSGAYENMNKKQGSAKRIEPCSSGSDQLEKRTLNTSTKNEVEGLIINDTPKSKIEHTPSKFTKQEEQVMKKFHILTPSTDTSSKVSSDTDCSDSTGTGESDYYQSFIKNFPKITAKVAPQLNDLRALEKTKQFLRKVYEESRQNCSYDTDSYKSSPEETAAQHYSLTSIDASLMNPIEYLKRTTKTSRKQEIPGQIKFRNIAHTYSNHKNIEVEPRNQLNFPEHKKHVPKFITQPCMVPATNIKNMQRDAANECNALLLRGLLQHDMSPNKKTNELQMLEVPKRLNFKGLFQKQTGIERFESGMHQNAIQRQASPECWAQSTSGMYHQLVNQQNIANSYFCHTQQSFGMPPSVKHLQSNSNHISKNIMSSQIQTTNNFYNFNTNRQRKNYLKSNSPSNMVNYQFEPQIHRVNKNFYNQNIKADFIQTSNANDSDSPLYEIVMLSSSSSSSSDNSHDFGMLQKGTDQKLYYHR